MQYNYFNLFLEANLVVQIVILILIFLSFSSWAIIFEKLFSLSKQMRKLKKFENFYLKNRGTNEQTIKALVGQNDVYHNLITFDSFKKTREFVITHNNQNYSVEELRSLIDQYFNVKMQHIENRLDRLGTIANTTPFIGLIGTVFGIMNSFQAIGESKNVSLAVVAPGIAEALFTTALGLIVAIPAMIFYNKFTAQIDYIYNSSEKFFDDISIIIANLLFPSSSKE
jgi:biopolymer transport protein TolQ